MAASKYMHQILEKVTAHGNEGLLLEIGDLLKKEHDRVKKWTYCKLLYREMGIINNSVDPSVHTMLPKVITKQLLISVKTNKIKQLQDSIKTHGDEGLYISIVDSRPNLISEWGCFVAGWRRRILPMLKPIRIVWDCGLSGDVKIKIWSKRCYIIGLEKCKDE